MVNFPVNFTAMFMRCLTVLLLGFFSISVTAQQPGAPYNPDFDGDTIIDALDVLQVLGLFGSQWLPADDDLDSTNELQTLSLISDTLWLLPGDSFVVLHDSLFTSPFAVPVSGVCVADLSGLGSTSAESFGVENLDCTVLLVSGSPCCVTHQVVLPAGIDGQTLQIDADGSFSVNIVNPDLSTISGLSGGTLRLYWFSGSWNVLD